MASATSTRQLRNVLATYLKGSTTLRDFAEVLASTLHEVPAGHGSADDEATFCLALDIELRLAEYSDGDLTERQLKASLRPLLDTYVVSFSHASSLVRIQGSASESITHQASITPVAASFGTASVTAHE
jgi:hypothetical protein